ncbi:MAG: alpha/beta hydrolase [Pirellulaceae bacterium]|nr:alpha/beta hydrolase [Pirellulaceae bacterium]
MLVDLVQTVTADGVRLHGALHSATAPRATGLRVDVLLGLSGVGSNFYGSSLAEDLTPKFLAAGLDVLWVNTRGHDHVAVVQTAAGPRRQGAAYETVDECRHDVAGWLDLLVDRGYLAPGIVGHSLGAIKALYSQAHAPHGALAALVALSPPRLSCRAFRAGEQGERFFEDLETARRHVEQGQPLQLFPARVPFPLIMGAAAYLDKYGPEERYNILKFAGRVACPHVFFYGGGELRDGGVAFAGLPEALESLTDRRYAARTVVIPDADHMYTSRRDALAERILAWLGERPEAS